VGLFVCPHGDALPQPRTQCNVHHEACRFESADRIDEVSHLQHFKIQFIGNHFRGAESDSVRTSRRQYRGRFHIDCARLVSLRQLRFLLGSSHRHKSHKPAISLRIAGLKTATLETASLGAASIARIDHLNRSKNLSHAQSLIQRAREPDRLNSRGVVERDHRFGGSARAFHTDSAAHYD